MGAQICADEMGSATRQREGNEGRFNPFSATMPHENDQ